LRARDRLLLIRASSSSSFSEAWLDTYRSKRQLAMDFVESITERHPEPVEGSDGMSVMRDVVDFETGSIVPYVVIRKVTRPFWQACIDEADTPGMRIHVAATGSPGTGKTACTPYLIRMLLLERRVAVVYHVRTLRKSGWLYEFVPGRDGDENDDPTVVVANVYPEQGYWKSEIPSLNDPSAYYVVDPGKTSDSCDPDARFLPKVILVTSPDSKHWGDGEFFKRRGNTGGTLKVFPVWELDELLHARPLLGPGMSDEEVENRYYQVGGIPRLVFTGAAFYGRVLERQQMGMNGLTADQVRRVAHCHKVAWSTFDESLPQNAAIAFRVSDADTGTFSEYAVDAVAPRVTAFFLREFAKVAWPTLEESDHPWIFEAHARYLLLTKSTYRCRRWSGPEHTVLQKTRTVVLGGCTEMRSVPDVIAAAQQRKMVVFHPVHSEDSPFDFLYQDSKGRFRAFLAVLANRARPVNAGALLRLEDAAGGPDKLTMYYMVPSFHFSKFTLESFDDGSGKNPPAGVKLPSCDVVHVSIPDPNRAGSSRRSAFLFVTSRL
jgi:hypothetical protein